MGGVAFGNIYQELLTSDYGQIYNEGTQWTNPANAFDNNPSTYSIETSSNDGYLLGKYFTTELNISSINLSVYTTEGSPDTGGYNLFIRNGNNTTWVFHSTIITHPLNNLYKNVSVNFTNITTAGVAIDPVIYGGSALKMKRIYQFNIYKIIPDPNLIEITTKNFYTNITINTFNATYLNNTLSTTNGTIKIRIANFTFTNTTSLPWELDTNFISIGTDLDGNPNYKYIYNNYSIISNITYQTQFSSFPVENKTVPSECLLKDSFHIKTEPGLMFSTNIYCVNSLNNNSYLLGTSSINHYFSNFTFNYKYNITISAAGYINRTYEVDNTTFILPATLLSRTYNGTELNIKNFWTNAVIPNALVTITSTNYELANISVNATDYLTRTFTNYNLSTFFTTQLYPIKNINIRFIDEVTSLAVNNVRFDVISEGFSSSLQTTNGTYFIENLTIGTYEIRHSLLNDTLRARSYYLTIPLLTEADANFTLRTINSNVSQLFTRKVVDQNGQPLQNYIFELQRFYTNLSTWATVERALISTQGDAVFSAIPNTQAYRYRIYDPSFNLIETSATFYLIDTNAEIRVIEAGDLLNNYRIFKNSASTFTISEAGNLILEYNDPSGSTQKICLNLEYAYRNELNISSVCMSETSATLTLPIDQSAEGRYSAFATATYNDGNEYIVNSKEYRFVTPDGAQYLGYISVLILLAGIAVCATLSFIDPKPGVVFMFFLLLAFSPLFLDMAGISIVAGTTTVLIGIIVLILYERGSRNGF
jgi:hypothetical protein